MTGKPLRIDETASLSMALSIMKKNSIRHLPVVRKSKLVGVISNRDIADILSKGVIDPEKILAKDAMTSNPYTVTANTPLFDVTAVMTAKKYGSVIVMDGEAVVGIFTTIDALRALHEITNEASRHAS